MNFGKNVNYVMRCVQGVSSERSRELRVEFRSIISLHTALDFAPDTCTHGAAMKPIQLNFTKVPDTHFKVSEVDRNNGTGANFL